MAKIRTVYVCSSCGASQPKWLGRCPVCQSWESLVEEAAVSAVSPAGLRPPARPVSLALAGENDLARTRTGLGELDRVLGGGLVPGLVALVGGEPGIGKSTLMLQLSDSLARSGAGVLYVSAEESTGQVGLRARRLGLLGRGVELLAETGLEAALTVMAGGDYTAVVVDSVQAMRSANLESAPGTVSQVRHVAGELAALAKERGLALFLVGHVTKDGALAGPMVLEHLVDTVLRFESEPAMRLRLIRAVKNRFGATDEVGVFEMGEKGLMEVPNPSAVLLAHRPEEAPGSAVCAAMSGTRPLLVEVQALVSPSPLAMPRRQALGVDPGRLSMLMAVLTIHAGLDLSGCDVFVNVAGGVKLSEPAADLAVCAAVASSLKSRPVPREMVCFGEVGLAGELRAVGRLEARLNEAARQGFHRALSAKSKAPKVKNMRLEQAGRLGEALEVLW